jgi:hypothetical protein
VLKQLSIIVLIFFILACQPNVPLEQPEEALLTTQCISSQSQCEVTTETSRFSIKFSQENLLDTIKGETPFTIEILPLTLLPTTTNESINIAPSPLKNSTITKVSGYLEGRDMFMGKVPVFFTPVLAQSATKSTITSLKKLAYVAETQLANCMAEKMVWRLWINVQSAEMKETFFIDFTSKH